MRKILLSMVALLLMAGSAATAGNYVTPGNGTNYTLSKLADIAGSGVTRDGSVYTMADSVTISAGDSFTLDNGVTLRIGDKVGFEIDGPVDFAVSEPTTITRVGDNGKPGHVSFLGDGVINIRNVVWDYVGMKTYGLDTLNIDSCTFKNYIYADRISGTIGVGGTGSRVHVTNTLFDHNDYTAIGGAANINVSYIIENCIFNKNQQVNRNMPMLNLQQGDTTIVRNNTFIGDTTKLLVGAISIANMLGYDADLYVLVENNTIDSCRYGINIQGRFKNAIIRNNIIRHNKYVYQNNPNYGGSGIAIYDSGKTKGLNLRVNGNRIEDNWWGITIMGGKDINLGKVEVDGQPLNPTDSDYNEGKNIFVNNGHGGREYDLAFGPSTSYLTVYAQNNQWGCEPQTAEAIEDCIDHQKDDATTGLAIFTPWLGSTTGIAKVSTSASVSGEPTAIYTLGGQRISTMQHGLNIVRYADGSVHKVLVK